MDYGSSYAVGTPQLGYGATGAGAPGSVPVAEAAVLPTPRPQRVHWSTMLFVAGLAVCFVGLLATLAGVPARLWYDVDGPPNRNKPSSMDPLQISRSLDGNMKWIDQSSSDVPGGYVGFIKSINRSEAAIPTMVSALVAMNASVQSIDAGLAEVSATTKGMGSDMETMYAVSAASAETMQSLNEDIGFLSGSMLQLATATQQLTTRMAGIESKAAGIAERGTSTALGSAKDLNASLPDTVPAPIMDDGKPAGAARGTGGGTAGAPVAAGATTPVTVDPGTTPAAGAQPAAPLADWQRGAIQ